MNDILVQTVPNETIAQLMATKAKCIEPNLIIDSSIANSLEDCSSML